MKEFEQALQRARSLVNAPAPEPYAPPADGTPTINRETGRPLKAGTEPDITANPAREATSLPLLDADMDQFRASFGADNQGGRNIDGAFRLLRTQILASMKDRQGQVLGITSAGPGAGKSFTAIHLAMACARRSEQHAVLADFDFRRPSIASYLAAVDFPSSLGYFRGDGPLDQFLTRNEGGNLRYLLTDRSSELSAEYLASSKMDAALTELTARSKDTLVIADLPPLMGCDDTLAIMPKLDGLVIVVAAGESSFGDVEQAVAQVPPEKVVATVLNKVDGTSSTYDYY